MKTPEEIRAEHARALVSADIPADRHNAVLDELSLMFEVHRIGEATEDHQLQQIPKVIKAAEKLRDLIGSMPVAVRASLGTVVESGTVDEPKGAFVLSDPRDPLDWLPLTTFIEQAKRVRDGTRREPGRQREPVTMLILEMFLMWDRVMPTHRGITRHAGGASPQDGLYSGPLLDLVQAVLTVECIEFESRDAVGRHLSDFAKQRDSVDAAH